MKLQGIIEQIPVFARVIGANWLRRKQEWVEEFISERSPWFVQMEKVLLLLLSHSPPENIIPPIKPQLVPEYLLKPTQTFLDPPYMIL